MRKRPIKARFIVGARGFVTVDGVPGLHLYPRTGEPFSIAFSPESFEAIRETLNRTQVHLASGKTGLVQ